MEGLLGTVNVGRHNKSSTANSTEKVQETVKVKYKPLQAFEVYRKSRRSEKEHKNTKGKNTLRFKDKDRSKHKSAVSIDSEIINKNYHKETSCNNELGCHKGNACSEIGNDGEYTCSELGNSKETAYSEQSDHNKTAYSELGESTKTIVNEVEETAYINVDDCEEVISKKIDVCRLHKTIELLTTELNNNSPYEVDNEATFDSFMTNGLLTTSAKKIDKRTRAETDASSYDKHKNYEMFTSQGLFPFTTGHEVKCIDSKTNNTLATIHLRNPILPEIGKQRQRKSSLPSSISSISPISSPIGLKHSKAYSPRPSSPNQRRRKYSKEILAGPVSPPRRETKRSNSFTDLFTGPKRYSAPNIMTSQLKTSLLKLSSPVNYIATDFGSCISPDLKPFAGLTKKLHTWAHRNNFNKPSRRIRNSLSETFPISSPKQISPGGSGRQQRKILGPEQEVISNEKTYNVSREREIVNNRFLQGCDFSLSSNLWYYGELDVLISFDDEDEHDGNEDCTAYPERQVTTGSFLVLLDKCQNLYYSFTYWKGNTLHVGSIPFQSGKYSIDFSSTEQLKFYSAKFLIAHLIEKNYLSRVPFTWLLDNLPYSMTHLLV